MKKKIFIVLGTLLLTGSVFGAASLASSKKEVEVSADTSHTICNGLYERVENANEVTPGKQFILATTYGYVFEGIGGNPAYAHADPGGVTMFGSYDKNLFDYEQDNTKFLYLRNKPAIILTAETGASGYSSSYVSFKVNIYIWGKLYSHYFGENDEESYDGRNDYKDTAWFLDGFGIRPTKDGKSTWELEYDDQENRMKMRKVMYDDETSYLCYSYSGARHHFNFGGLDRAYINLYRKVEDENIVRSFEPSPYSDPNKLTYRKGETIEYDGLSVIFRIKRDEDIYDSYVLKYDENTSGLFSEPSVVSEYTTAYVRIFNDLQYAFQIAITTNASLNVFNQITNLPPDIRGTYLLATDDERILNASQEAETNNNYSTVDEEIFYTHTITSNTERLDQSIIRIVRTKINDNWYYHATNYLGQYLTISDEEVNGAVSGDYYLDYTNTATINNAVQLTSNSFKIGNYYLCSSNASQRLICFTPDNYGVYFFKLSSSTDSVSSQINDYVSYFINRTGSICASTGDEEDEFEKFSELLWNDLATEFNKLSCDAQGVFASTTYTHNAEEIETKENVVDRYDYILAKYNKEDFMLRKVANTYVSNYANSSKLIINRTGVGSIVVIAVAMIFMATTMALLIIKKKKPTLR